ncbi:MAG: LysR family transcriptional regulator [Tardiphaga sp.]|nr:LysR family transcriptional regulator [Tardiphaga sp.]
MSRVAHLKAIQVFEVVALTGSLTVTADVMAVTQSAVSYHIQILEADLGVKLFDRGSRGVRLTESGLQLLPFVRDGLQSIERGMQTIRKIETSAVVRVAVLPMFASRWLAPRLSEFWDKYPDAELSFTHDSSSFTNSINPGEIADVAIQWGFGNWPNVESRVLLQAPLVAACSPDLLKRSPIACVADFAAHPLLHVDNHVMWQQWLRQAGADESLADRGLMMGDRHFQLSATINGTGISLFLRSFIQSELDKGTLVCALQAEHTTDFAYHLTRPRQVRHHTKATRFYDWILGQASGVG